MPLIVLVSSLFAYLIRNSEFQLIYKHLGNTFTTYFVFSLVFTSRFKRLARHPLLLVPGKKYVSVDSDLIDLDLWVGLDIGATYSFFHQLQVGGLC